MHFDIKKLEAIATTPGVYLMKGTGGTILYVGKAKNLKQRLKQYFYPGRDGRFMVPFLVAKVFDVETILVSSEKEALLLENNLIKQHKPRYNALLKDDKAYIALKINTKHNWPILQLVRYKGRPKADGTYFGPYTSAQGARKTLDLLQKLFPLRQCSDQEFARRTRPCILYDMKRCIAPCVQKCTHEEYQHHVDRTVKFLRGQDKEVLRDLYEEMQKCSDSLDFEQAGLLLKTIRQIEGTIEGQSVDKPLGIDFDALGVYRQGEEVLLSQLLFRQGKLMGSRHYNFANIAQDNGELLESFLLQQYDRQEDLPHEILLPAAVDDVDSLSEILTQNKNRRIQVLIPQRGEKRSLVEMAEMNAEAAFKKEKDAQAIREKTLLEMQDRFHLRQYPRRIECFDNSNISGTEPVSALVAFTEGEKDSARYRKYKIRSVQSPDDYSTMHEVLVRRYKRAKDENDLPDLLIVDGGKGHLNIAMKALADLNIVNIDVIGVAKEEGRHDKGMTSEQVFLPNVKDPILLKRTSPILYLLQQIRDEAHRVAITFHRKRRNKATLTSSLDAIPGIGPVKRKALLRHFGSVKKLLEATPDDLHKLTLLSPANIQAINEFIANQKAT
jgi:excinuclease ABC subunit C